MKSRLAVTLLLLATATTLVGTRAYAANDGAHLYKSKCSHCHAAHGEGKPSMKAPALKGTSLEEGQIVDTVTKGDANRRPPHKKRISGLTEEQAKLVADYVKGLK